MKKKLLSILFAACMIFMLLPSKANALAGTAKIGDTEYPTLSAALTAAKEGDTITLSAGDFSLPNFVSDNVNGSPAKISFTQYGAIPGINIVTKGITIKGAENHASVIDGEICIYAANVTLEGLTIKRTTPPVTDTYTINSPVIQFFSAKNVYIKNNIVSGNYYSDASGAHYSNGYCMGQFWGNDMVSGRIEGNTTYGGIGIGKVYTDGTEGLVVSGNTIMSCRQAAITFYPLNSGSKITVTGNEIKSYNDWAAFPYAIRFEGDAAAYPATVNGVTTGISAESILEVSKVLAQNNTFKGKALTVDLITLWAALPVASIGNNYYAKVSDAIAAAANGNVIKLESNSTEDVVVPTNLTITLDLNGKTLTGVDTADVTHIYSDVELATVINHGNLTVIDSVGSGLITEVSAHYKKSAIFNAPDGTLDLKSGTISNSGDCNYYVLHNQGTATIEGATLKSGTADTATILNGYSTSSWQNIPADAKVASLKISAGTILGGRYAIKNGEAYASLQITGGNISKGAADGATIANYSNCKAVISGGTLDADGAAYVVECKNKSNTSGAGTDGLSITGGDFTGMLNAAANQKLVVSGGYFTKDPSSYLVNGKVAVASDKDGYAFMVGTAPENVEVKLADPVVKKIDTTGLSGDALTQANTLNDLANAVTTDPTDTGLVTSAGKEAQNPAVNNTEARKALGIKADAQDTVTVVIEPRLSVEPIDYDATRKELTLDIKAVYDTIATTDPDNITEVNSVKIGKTKELEVKDGTPVVVKFEVPSALVKEVSTGVYESLTVEHVKKDGSVYYYTAKVAAEGSTVYGTMTVEHGFSNFIIKALDTRKLTVTYDVDPNNPVEYDITAVNNATLPVVKKDGYTFSGYQFEGVSGTYTTMTASLWNTLMNGVATNKSVNATAKYTKVVNTADTTNIGLPFAVLGVALLGLGIVLINKRRRSYR